MMEYGLQMGEDFEPQTRARSNTWPLPRPEDNNNSNSSCTAAGGGGAVSGGVGGGGGGVGEGGEGGLGHPLLPKKTTSRRNAWGNLSYADLITQAIGSSPDKRLTLSQIYDWMVTNVPYFKDKGDSNSSAGWKNSIRHNLSLHNRFMRVQNEGTGKSSWWMLNPDAKPGKAARRRATSMETSKYEKKRGRIRKKIEAMRNGTTLLDTPSPSSSINEGLDVYPDSPQVPLNFQLSPDFRPRASSNASSCGGRLSPILCVSESGVDLHDNQVPPMSPWSSLDYAALPPFSSQNSYSGPPPASSSSLDRFATEQLAGNLANTMKLNSDCFGDFGLPAYALPAPFNFTNSHNSTNNSSSEFKALPSQQREDPPDYYNYLQQEKAQQAGVTPAPAELDFSLEQLGQFECDVEQVLQQELNLGGEIDFNFPPVNHLHNSGTPVSSSGGQLQPPGEYGGMSSSGVVHHQAAPPAATLGRHWVH